MPRFPEGPSREALFCLPLPVSAESSLRAGKPSPQRSVWLMALARCVCRQ
jgi:hypothetical protein